MTPTPAPAGLPPLPEPDGYAAIVDGGSVIVPPRDFAKHNAYAVFTADQMQAYALAALAAQQVPPGWKLVPVEPTPKMLCALWDHRDSMRGESENRIARAGYDAMLASAPQPAQQEGQKHLAACDGGGVMRAAKAVNKHWNEFGPLFCFDEHMDALDKALSAAAPTGEGA